MDNRQRKAMFARMNGKTKILISGNYKKISHINPEKHVLVKDKRLHKDVGIKIYEEVEK